MYHAKVLLKRFHLNDQTIDSKVRTALHVSIIDFGSKGLIEYALIEYEKVEAITV